MKKIILATSAVAAIGATGLVMNVLGVDPSTLAVMLFARR